MPPAVIENEIDHADEHVFFDVGIKLPVHFLQNIRRRRILRCLTAQDAAANRHDERRRHAFARNIGNRHAEPFVVHFDVIEIIAAHLVRWNVDAVDLKSANGRRFGREQECAGCRARSPDRDRAASFRWLRNK